MIDRIGPRESFELEDASLHRTPGLRGERVIGALYWFGDESVRPEIRHADETRPTLSRQVEAWLGALFPGVALNIQRMPGTNQVTLGIRTGPETDFHRPQHVGFGLTCVLPILVVCLMADRDELVLIENPEAHLHPRAQAELGRFLARVAQSGVQIIVETHSDHILNGARRAVKDDIINPENVMLHFFRLRGDDHETQVISPRIDPQGRIDSWPEGFFDQFDKDTMTLAGF